MCRVEILILNVSLPIMLFGKRKVAGIRGFNVNILFISDMKTQTFAYVIRRKEAKQCAMWQYLHHTALSHDHHGLTKVVNNLYQSCYWRSVAHLTNAFSFSTLPYGGYCFSSLVCCHAALKYIFN